MSYGYINPGDGQYPRQIVEHQIRPARLDPMDAAQRAQVHTPTILSVPQPYIIQTAPTDQGRPNYVMPTSQTKQDMMEMMMLQNAQMHQMMMNQMMISTLPKPQQPRTVGLDSNKIAVDIDEIISLKSEMRNKSEQPKRPPSVHHHHYDTNPSSRPPPHLPPLTQPYHPHMHPHNQYGYGLGYNNFASPRLYPTEVAPLKQPVARPKPKPKTPVKTPDPPKRKYGPLPFPGPWPLRKFRHAAYAAFFIKALQKQIKKPPISRLRTGPMNDDFMFPIKLKEIVAALHHIYLQPTNKIGSMLPKVTAESAIDLSIVLQPQAKDSKPSKAYSQALDYVREIVEGFPFEITEIMPAEGVLGTHKRSEVFDLVQPGNIFPRGYLWQIEKDMLTLDYQGRTVSVSQREAFILLTGIFIGRALVTTLLLKPVEYGLTKIRPILNAQKNLRLLASIFIFLLRKLYTEPNQPIMVPGPVELGGQIHGDRHMEALYAKLKTSFDYAKDLFTKWGNEYAKRLQFVGRSETRMTKH